MIKRTVALVACLAALSACSGGDDEPVDEQASEPPRLSLADACVEVAAMDSQRVTDEEYAVAMREIDGLIDRAEPSAVAALTSVREAYAAQINAAQGQASVVALRQELAALESFADSCQAVGSPLE